MALTHPTDGIQATKPENQTFVPLREVIAAVECCGLEHYAAMDTWMALTHPADGIQATKAQSTRAKTFVPWCLCER